MNKTSWIVGIACAILGTGNVAIAQTIVFSPPAPSGGQTVIATFSEPFNCAAPQPKLTAESANSFIFNSTFTNGIVNCGIILSPAPVLSNFPISLGALAPGTYEITWNIYKSQSQGDPVLLLTTSASVQVAAGDTAVAITPGFTGNWYDPAESGHGFSIEVLPNNLMLAQWYVFSPGGGPQWIVATGPISNDVAVLSGAYPVDYGGARFPPNFDPQGVLQYPWGTIIFTFTDCNSGVVSWQPVVSGYSSGSMPIKRLTMPAGLTCP